MDTNVNSKPKLYARLDDETHIDYFVRLFSNAHRYGLSRQNIADLLNADRGTNFDESAFRKEWASFKRGIDWYKSKQADDLAVDLRILDISDLHIPYQLPIETFGKYRGITDVLLLAGDISDCQALSVFDKTYRIDPMDEILQTRQYLCSLIEYIKPKKVVAFYGNHDIRLQRFLSQKLDSSIIELMPKTTLELIFVDGFHRYDKRVGVKTFYEPLVDIYNDIEIEYVDDWYTQIGETIFCHPIAFSSGIMKTSEKAVQYFHNLNLNFSSLIMAHTHRVGFYTIGNIDIYEQGCTCDTSQISYGNGKLISPQKEGYMYVCQDKTGKLLRDSTVLERLN